MKEQWQIVWHSIAQSMQVPPKAGLQVGSDYARDQAGHSSGLFTQM